MYKLTSMIYNTYYNKYNKISLIMYNNIHFIILTIIISFLVSACDLSIIDYDPMQRSTSNTTVVQTTTSKTSQTNSYPQYYNSYYQEYYYYPYYYDYYGGYYYPYYYSYYWYFYNTIIY